MMPLYGIVVCGGKSSRMGTDKSLINYYRKPQRYHLYDLLKPLCSKVFISINEQQSENINTAYPYLADADEYKNIGPIAALLTAFKMVHAASFLLIGCDYPLIKEADISKLIAQRENDIDAICYYKQSEEPLVALYENRISEALKSFYESGNYSLKKLLQQVNTKHIAADNGDSLWSIDTPEDSQKIKATLLQNGF